MIRPTSINMAKVLGFAMFSTRRQDEITRIRGADLHSVPTIYSQGTQELSGSWILYAPVFYPARDFAPTFCPT